MGKAPAFQFYASDWAHSTAVMTLEERGAYITLLAWSWEHGPVPDDMKRIAAILGTSLSVARRVFAEVSTRWMLADGGWTNRRLEATRARHEQFAEAQSERGRSGATARWRKQCSSNASAIAQAMPSPMLGDSSPISDLRSPDPLSTERLEGEGKKPSPSDLRDAWNAIVTEPLPKCRELSDQRKRHAQIRLTERSLEDWQAVIARINASPFCRGDNDRGWRADFDWLLQPGTALKVLEGKYDARPTLVRRGNVVDATDEAWARIEARVKGTAV
jgi:uncharacterized protein YdaU (DUF1376 family)